jgi:hypothetical protein
MAKLKDPTKAYDSDEYELTPGDRIIIHAEYIDMAKTDAGATIRVRVLASHSGYSPVIALHESQATKET